MPTIQMPAHGWTPRAYQADAWRASRNRNIHTIVLAWARRHGKDEMAMHTTAIKALERVGNYYHALPHYSQARKAIWEARNPHTGRIRWQDAFPSEVVKKVDNQTMMLTLINGSTWQLVGSDNIDALMGTTPTGVVFSEAALSDPTTYAFFRPILLENSGWSMHVSSTRGKNHFYHLFQSLRLDPTAFVSHISAYDTDVFTDAQLQNELRTYIRLYGEALGRSLFEQEYLSNWDAAVVGSVWGQELTQLEKTNRVQPLIHDPRFPVHTSWDLGVSDPTAILFWQSIAGQERLIDWYQSSDSGLEHFVDVLNHKPYVYGDHLWPHDGAAREFGSGTSRKSQAKRLGLNVRVMPNVPKTDSIALGSQLIKRTVINADPDKPAINPEDNCEFILQTLKQYRFKFSPETKTMSKNPVHDEHSHIADALATYAIARAAPGRVATPSSPEVLAEEKTFNHTRMRHLLNSQTSVRGAWG